MGTVTEKNEEPVVRVASEGSVATVTLDRPEAMNAITVELARELEAAIRAAAAEARVVLIEGAGDHFCVGGDFKAMGALLGEGEAAVAGLFDAFHAACRAIAEVPVPVLAVVRGYAMAGGFELMQSCDLAIVAAEAKIADNHLNFGMVPAGGGSQRLPRLLGRQRALAHILTGERLSGADAARLGLAFRAVPAAELDAAAAALAAELAAKDPAALAATKRLVRDGLEIPLAEGLAREQEAVLRHLGRAGSMDAFRKRSKESE